MAFNKEVEKEGTGNNPIELEYKLTCDKDYTVEATLSPATASSWASIVVRGGNKEGVFEIRISKNDGSSRNVSVNPRIYNNEHKLVSECPSKGVFISQKGDGGSSECSFTITPKSKTFETCDAGTLEFTYAKEGGDTPTPPTPVGPCSITGEKRIPQNGGNGIRIGSFSEEVTGSWGFTSESGINTIVLDSDNKTIIGNVGPSTDDRTMNITASCYGDDCKCARQINFEVSQLGACSAVQLVTSIPDIGCTNLGIISLSNSSDGVWSCALHPTGVGSTNIDNNKVSATISPLPDGMSSRDITATLSVAGGACNGFEKTFSFTQSKEGEDLGTDDDLYMYFKVDTADGELDKAFNSKLKLNFENGTHVYCYTVNANQRDGVRRPVMQNKRKTSYEMNSFVFFPSTVVDEIPPRYRYLYWGSNASCTCCAGICQYGVYANNDGIALRGDAISEKECPSTPFTSEECACLDENDASNFTTYRKTLLSRDEYNGNMGFLGKKLTSSVEVYYYDGNGVEQSCTATLIGIYGHTHSVGEYTPSHIGKQYHDLIFRNGYGGLESDSNKRYAILYKIKLPPNNPLPNA